MIIGMIYGYHDNFMTKVRVSSVHTVSSVHFISTGHESTQNIFIYLKKRDDLCDCCEYMRRA